MDRKQSVTSHHSSRQISTESSKTRKPSGLSRTGSNDWPVAKPGEAGVRLPRSGSTACSVSDVESDSNKYKKMAKKYAHEKNRYKDQLRKLIDDIEDKSKTHRLELEKTQYYFQDQINELTDERDKLRSELEKMQEMALEEKATEKRPAKKLEETIAKLTQNLREKEKENEALEKATSEKIFQLEEQVRSAKETHINYNRDLQTLTRTYNIEKEQYTLQVKKEKDIELDKIISEKNGIISVLQGTKEQLEKQASAESKQKEEYYSLVKSTVDQLKIENEQKVTQVHLSYKKEINDLREELQKRLTESDRQHRIELENHTKKYEKHIETISFENNRNVNSMVEKYKKEITDVQQHNLRLQAENNTLVSQTGQEISKQDEEYKKKYRDTTVEFQAKLEAKEKEISDLTLKYQKISGETEENSSRLKEQLNYLQNNIKKIQENSQTLNAQFITTLNKQKETAEKEMVSRDQNIQDLQRQLKQLGEESIDRINSLERKLKSSTEELKDVTDKYSSLRSEVEKVENGSNIYKAESQRYKQIIERIGEKAKIFQGEKESFEKKIQVLEYELKNKDTEINVYKAEIVRLNQCETKIKDEAGKTAENIAKLRIEIEQKKQEIENKVQEIASEQVKCVKIQSLFSQAQQKMQSLETELLKKDTITTSLKTELETVSRTSRVAAEEFTRFRRDFSEDMKQRMVNLQQDKDKQTSEFNVKFSSMEQALYNSEQTKKAVIAALNSMTIERDKLKVSLDTYSNPSSEYNTRLSQVPLLKDENSKLRSNFANEMNNIVRENSSKEQELIRLRQVARDYDTKDMQLAQMTIQLNNMQQNYKHTLDKLMDEHKKEREELKNLREKAVLAGEHTAEIDRLKNTLFRVEEEYRIHTSILGKKVSDSEIVATQTEQRIEKLKLDFLKQLAEAKKLPPEDQEKLASLEKEKSIAMAQLVSSEKKLEKLQFEFANASAIIKNRALALNDREAELKKQAEIQNNAPPRILDPTLKKSRDDALAQLRQTKLELNRLKEEAMDNLQKLQVTEHLVKNMEREKQIILQTQSELRETFVNSLNHQQDRYEKDGAKKDERIKELEILLMDRLKQ